MVYALAVDSSPFRTLTSVEPAECFSVLINPDAPADSAKVQKAIKELASSYGFIDDCKYRVTISGSPPRGKGLGSSSIDVASALLAIKDQRDLRISAPELFRLMCRVERSDYLFNSGTDCGRKSKQRELFDCCPGTKMPRSGLGYRSSGDSKYPSSPASRPCPSIFQRRVPGTLRHDTKRRNREAASSSHPKCRIERSHPAEKWFFHGAEAGERAAERRPDRCAHWNNPRLRPAGTDRQGSAKIYLGFRRRPVFGYAHGLCSGHKCLRLVIVARWRAVLEAGTDGVFAMQSRRLRLH